MSAMSKLFFDIQEEIEFGDLNNIEIAKSLNVPLYMVEDVSAEIEQECLREW